MTKDDRSIIHVIDEQGNKCTVHSSEKLGGKYQFDVDWYLANGYSLAEDVFMEIEQTGEIIKQTLNGDFDDFDLLSDKAQKHIMKHWTPDIWAKYRHR